MLRLLAWHVDEADGVGNQKFRYVPRTRQFHRSNPVAGRSRGRFNFESLTEKIETVSPAGRPVFHVFAALGEFERNLIRERTEAGLKIPGCRLTSNNAENLDFV